MALLLFTHPGVNRWAEEHLLENDNCVSLKLAMTLALLCVLLCTKHKIEPFV